MMTIAGSDCSAGAGLQADLKAAHAMGAFALTAVTCVVSEAPGKCRTRQQKLFINSHRFFPHQAVARRGDHDRVHHDGNIRPVQHPMHRTDDSRP